MAVAKERIKAPEGIRLHHGVSLPWDIGQGKKIRLPINILLEEEINKV
jgi:hypothetical protein